MCFFLGAWFLGGPNTLEGGATGCIVCILHSSCLTHWGKYIPSLKLTASLHLNMDDGWKMSFCFLLAFWQHASPLLFFPGFLKKMVTFSFPNTTQIPSFTKTAKCSFCLNHGNLRGPPAHPCHVPP